MNKRVSVGVTVALIFLAVAITFTATMIFSMNLFDSKVLGVTERAAMYDKVTEIDKVVRQNYYYPIDDTYLYDSIAKGYVSGLDDPDTKYLTSEEIAARNAAATGVIVSAGVEAEEGSDRYLKVTYVHPGSSASQAGVQAGDTITHVEGQNVLELTAREALDMFPGTEGSRLNLTYTRDNEEVAVELTRTSITTQSVYGTLLEDDTFYLRIANFNDTTLTQFDYEVNIALESDMVGLIIDVRSADGGHNIADVATMLDKLLPTGTLVRATYPNGDTKVLYTSDDSTVSVPIVVIVNEKTTGLAELFAAVLADSDNCRVVGKTTAGKGTLQQLIQFTDGSGIELTTALLLAPKSGAFDEAGVRPAFDTDAPDGFTLPLGEPEPDSDPQYQKAREVLTSMLR